MLSKPDYDPKMICRMADDTSSEVQNEFIKGGFAEFCKDKAFPKYVWKAIKELGEELGISEYDIDDIIEGESEDAP